jgi:hypothetical protein
MKEHWEKVYGKNAQNDLGWYEEYSIPSLDSVHLWHDRAVLHFFTELADQYMYFSLLKKLLEVQGYAIIPSFNLEGAEKCSGLPVHRYDAEMLQDRMGHGFELIKDFNHVHAMPGGDSRDYVYTLFRRIS